MRSEGKTTDEQGSEIDEQGSEIGEVFFLSSQIVIPCSIFIGSKGGYRLKNEEVRFAIVEV